ncbi:MAG: hypothetical protein KDC05_12015 [Bacteroidales bacterium]|nr:hypothetical protein [Bacteroidales bacterium]
MRNILLLLLPLGLMLNSLNQALIYYNFLIQRDYIVKNLCVERNKEVNTCQGCCQLEKKLNEAKPDNKTDLPFPDTKVKEITVFLFDLKKSNTSNPEAGLKTDIRYLSDYHFLFYPSIFHPPQNIA